MLKRSSSSSLRLWTHAHTKGGERFLSAIQPRSSSSSSRRPFFAEEREEQRKERDAPDYTREREREMIRLNPTTTTTRKSLSPSFSLRVECLSQNTQDSTHYWAHARAQKKNRSPLSSFLARCCFFWRHKVEHSSTSKGSTKNAL